MDDKNFPGCGLEAIQPGEQGVPVRMRGQTAQCVDSRSYRNALAKELHASGPITDPPAERGRGLEAGEQDRTFGSSKVVFEMVLDAPAVTHAARGHDDGARADAVECFRFLHVLDEVDVDRQLSALVRGKEPSSGVVEKLAVLQGDLRGVRCEFGGACLEIRESDAKLPKTRSTFAPCIR